MARQALGKGLGALIPGANAAGQEKRATNEIDVNKVKTSHLQPRKTFGSEKMEELINSVKEKGIIEPILVKEAGDMYEIIAGERRFRAAQRAGLKTVPAIIKNVTPAEQLEIALIENIQREDLNPVEEAMGYKNLMELKRLTQEELADKLGKNRATVANAIRLLKLPKSVQDALVLGDIMPGHAKVLLGIADPSRQKALCDLAARTGMPVRKLEEMIKKDAKAPKKAKAPRSADLLAIENKLKVALGTNVRIKGNDKKGVIEVEYYNQEDLERIMDTLKIKY